MATKDLYRWAGLAGLLSGLFLVIQYVGLWITVRGTFTLGLFLIAAWILGLYAITGVYLFQREESGTLGAVAYAVNFLGLALVVARASAANFVFRQLPPETVQGLLVGGVGPTFLAAGLVLLIGTLLFGWATFKAGVFPRWAAVVYMLGFLLFVVGTFVVRAVTGSQPEAAEYGTVVPIVSVGGIIAGVGMAWLSYALRSMVGSSPEPEQAQVESPMQM